MRSIFSLLILIPFLVHCSSDKNKEQSNTSREFEVVEEFRIESSLEADQFYFVSPSNLTIGKDGSIFVGDAQLPTISMFDAEGSFVKTIGKEGRGPGEYITVGGLETLPDGRIVLWDQRNGRVNFYSQDGEYISSQAFAIGYYSEKVFEIGFNKNLFFKKGVFDPEKREVKETVWAEYSQTGEVLDTLFIPREAWADKRTYVVFSNSGNEYPFTETNVTAIHPSGFLVTGYNGEYSIKRLNNDSSEVLYKREIQKEKVKEAEIPQWEKFNRNFGTQVNIPDTKPYFKSIKVDADGRIWVWRYVEAMQRSDVYPRLENSWWEQPTFDVFLESGEFYGTVKLPFNVKFKEAKDENVWAIHTDENGEKTVVQYKLSVL